MDLGYSREETPDMYAPEPLPPPQQTLPQFKTVGKNDARHCYICGYACIEYADYQKYLIFMHWDCWSRVKRVDRR